ncbi:MAG: M20/M25/M40 family metallo-hydrolase [Acidobacteria bacterium]|nr:M20/M25/M40 family metallo-hydrolase [Acidobacteriota bacterium]
MLRLWALGLLLLTPLAAGPREVVNALLADPSVRKALDFIQANEPAMIEQQIALTELPAPPFAEQARGLAYKKLFEERGLRDVRIDEAGNVIGERPGRFAGPRVAFTAHLDTVFPAETEVKVRREGTMLHAPGIGDDGRGLAVVLAVIEALGHAGIETDGPITFVGTVGEEGLGDLRGVKHLFETELAGKIDRFVSVDGTRYGITDAGVGSYRYRVTFSGPGGHSYGSFGMTNPIHAMGRLIAKIADFEVPAEPKTTFSVGRVGGGTSVNSIAYEAWFEVDMRSPDKDSLETVHGKFQSAARAALAEEKARWADRGGLAMDLERVGFRPAGANPAGSAVVEAAVEATRALGLEADLRAGSTDANVGMAAGVPSITIGGGGSGEGAHSPGESFDTTDSWKGSQRALLVALALASRLE